MIRDMAPLPRLEDLDGLERAGLCALWVDLFDRPVPKSLSQPMLRRVLGFELQARRHGGLPRILLRALASAGADETSRPPHRLRPGGRFIREWGGVSHVVDVTADGYLWQGRSYRSLSAIARAITGAHWSGPRFFGLEAAAAVAGTTRR